MSETLRRLHPEDQPAMLALINAAAERYRGVIPDDCFGEPYMSAEELAHEIDAGVGFWGVERDGRLLGVMGAQPVKDVVLIRHAYVAPDAQGTGVGSRLLAHLLEGVDRPVLVGTWAAADWAVRFYEGRGFERVAQREIAPLLRRYWNISDRQVETSVVLRLG
jgi:N-acetylglutamate synthase-like GNAT family acetyltransferase